MSLNLAERVAGYTGAGYRNAAAALELLDKDWGLFVAKDKSHGFLRRLHANGAKQLPVYRRSFLALVSNRAVVKTRTEGNYEVYQLPKVART